MRSLMIHFFNCASALSPVREMIGLRRLLLRMGGVKIGSGVRVTGRVMILGSNMIIGDASWIGQATFLSTRPEGGIRIGRNVDIGPRCTIVTGSHHIGPASHRAGSGTSEAIIIGDGCWIGASCTILGGARIGAGCVVAAGAVVRAGDYPANTLLAGVPAVAKRELPAEGGSPATAMANRG